MFIPADDIHKALEKKLIGYNSKFDNTESAYLAKLAASIWRALNVPYLRCYSPAWEGDVTLSEDNEVVTVKLIDLQGDGGGIKIHLTTKDYPFAYNNVNAVRNGFVTHRCEREYTELTDKLNKSAGFKELNDFLISTDFETTTSIVTEDDKSYATWISTLGLKKFVVTMELVFEK